MPKFEDLTGKQFYKLTVMYRAADYIQPSGQHKRMWHCKCDCGNECDVRASDLKSGNTRSCGCFQQESRGKHNFDNLIGQTFGRLTVIERLPNHITPSGQTKTIWKCRCECGNECNVYASQLKHGIKSCGCISEESKEKKRIAKEFVNQRKNKISQAKFIVNNNLSHTTEDTELNDLISHFQKQKENERIEKATQRAISVLKKAQKKKEYLKNNSLAVQFPEIAAEWNYEKNDALTPNDITKGCNKKVWWKCSNGHEWKAVISSRTNGNGCPYCSGLKLYEGFNDLATKNPELLSEWDYKKNKIKPNEIKSGSSNIVWWICPIGHSYDMRVSSRTGKQKCGCPYCSVPAKRVLKGFNDLETKYPDLAKEWHPTKNGDLKPDNVFCGSAKKIWWIGKCGHEYEQKIVSRVNGGNCPYCSHQKLLKGFNDLETTHPNILKEWDYKKNDVLPSEIGVGTHKKIWWICPFGHSYQAYPSNRCGASHSGCPICDKENHTSFPEQALYYYISKYYPDAINSDKSAIGMELDIYIPSLKIAVEYDGKNWHKNNKYELKKNSVCRKSNILLIRIREEGLETYDDCYCIVRNNVRSNTSLTDTIKKLLYDVDNSLETDIDVDRDSALIYGSYINTRKSHSLKNMYPELSKEWHPSKNGLLTAEMVAPMTNKKVWWLGACGHEWQATVTGRVYMKAGCPICSGKKIVSGINDLKSIYPTLCESWDYKKNNTMGFTPDSMAPHSDNIIWWKCNKCGFEWQQKVDVVVRSYTKHNGNGCPECAKIRSATAKHKPVMNIETGEVFNSIKEAANKFSISPSYISAVCRGRIETAKGYHWKYINSADNT